MCGGDSGHQASGGVKGSAPRGGGPGGGPGGVAGTNASGGVIGGGPSGVPGDIPSDGGVTGNGHTRIPSRHIPHNSGGVMGAVSPMSMGMSYRGGYQGGTI